MKISVIAAPAWNHADGPTPHTRPDTRHSLIYFIFSTRVPPVQVVVMNELEIVANSCLLSL